MKTATLITAVLLAGCTSLEKQQSHERAQVEIVRVQREASAKEAEAASNAQIALYQSLVQLAAASPESADSAILAMALVGQGAADDNVQTPVIALQQQRNEAIEVLKVVTPTIGGVVTNVGMAALNASVSKASIRQQAAISINDSNNDARIVESVSQLGRSAVASVGDSYTVTDSGQLNTGTFTTNTDSFNTTDMTTSTTTSTSNAVTDSYNSTDQSTTDNSVTDNSVTDNTDNSVVTYGGDEMTVRELIEMLKATGEPYAVRIGESTYTDSDQSDDSQTCVPTFSGYVCS